VTILDTRNGRMVLDYSGIENASQFQLKIDPASRKIGVQFSQLQVELAMADEPLDKANTRIAPRAKADPPAKNAVKPNAARARINRAIPAQRAVRPAAPRAVPR
jgi:hypothetical protein